MSGTTASRSSRHAGRAGWRSGAAAGSQAASPSMRACRARRAGALPGRARACVRRPRHRPPCPRSSPTRETPSWAGHESSLDRLIGHGRPVVLNFFAGTCASCSAEMPGFERAYESSGNRVLFVGLDVGPFTGMGSHDDATRLLRQLGIRYPAAYAVDDAPLRTYGVQAMPTTLFFEARARLVNRSDGARTESELGARVQRLLGGSPPRSPSVTPSALGWSRR